MESKPGLGGKVPPEGFPCKRSGCKQIALQVDGHELHNVGSIYKTEVDLEGRGHDGESDGLNMAGIKWSLPFGAMIRTTVIGPRIILFSSDHLLC